MMPPTLADRVAVSTDEGLEDVVQISLAALKYSPILTPSHNLIERKRCGCVHAIRRLTSDLLQKALVILLIGRVLGVKHVGRAVFFQSPSQVAFVLQSPAEAGVRHGIIGVQAQRLTVFRYRSIPVALPCRARGRGGRALCHYWGSSAAPRGILRWPHPSRLFPQRMPRLTCASSLFGFRRSASRYSVMSPSQSPFSLSATPEVDVRLAIIRVQAQRLAVLLRSPVPVALIAKRQAEVRCASSLFGIQA